MWAMQIEDSNDLCCHLNDKYASVLTSYGFLCQKKALLFSNRLHCKLRALCTFTLSVSFHKVAQASCPEPFVPDSVPSLLEEI